MNSNTLDRSRRDLLAGDVSVHKEDDLMPGGDDVAAARCAAQRLWKEHALIAFPGSGKKCHATHMIQYGERSWRES